MTEYPDDLLAKSLFLSEEPVRADLAIVFGSSDSAEAARRANRACQLYQDGYVSRILFSGGDPLGRGQTEAAAMVLAIIQNGVPPDALLVENRSNSTAENILYCRHLLVEARALPGLRTILLVSAAWHLRRIRAMAKSAFGPDVSFICCAAQSGPDFDYWRRSPEGSRALALELEMLAVVEAET